MCASAVATSAGGVPKNTLDGMLNSTLKGALNSIIALRIVPGFAIKRPAINGRSLSRAARVIGPVIVKGRHQYFSPSIGEGNQGRQWQIKCFCGKLYTATTLQIRRLSVKSLSCGCMNMRKPHAPRKLTFRTRPGSERHLNKTYGRLTVVRWVDRVGWECKCECGALETIQNSKSLGSRGLTRCPHK